MHEVSMKKVVDAREENNEKWGADDDSFADGADADDVVRWRLEEAERAHGGGFAEPGLLIAIHGERRNGIAHVPRE